MAADNEILSTLDWTGHFFKKTGEVREDRKPAAKLSNLLFTIGGKKEVVKIRGSLHKFANNGAHNHDQLPLSRFIQEVVPSLSPYIADTDRIHGIEFGVNLNTSFNPSLFIKNLLSFKGENFNFFAGPKQYRGVAEFSQFSIKIYDTGLRYSTPEWILRIELHYDKLARLFGPGLTWGELRNPETWVYLAGILHQRSRDIIFWDPSIVLTELPEPDRSFLKEARNPIYWKELKRNDKPDRIRKRFQELIARYGTTFPNIPDLVRAELDSLIDQKTESDLAQCYHFEEKGTGAILPPFKSDLAQCYPLLMGNIAPANAPTFAGPAKNLNTVPIKPAVRECQITGADISMQKPGSKFLCSTGLRWLLKNDLANFEKLKMTRLTKRRQNEPIEVQIREIAHSIRNEYHNPVNNAAKGIKKILQYPTLFNQEPYIRNDKKELARLSFMNRATTNPQMQ